MALAPGDGDILLVDGSCRLCRGTARALAPHLPARSQIRSFREPGALAGLPVAAERCERALQLVEAGGRVSEGLEALVRALRRRWYGPLLRLYYLPLLRPLLDGAYRRLAAARREWGG